jgi:hypothetical protein
MRHALFLPLVLALAACGDDGFPRVEVLVTDHPDVMSTNNYDRLAVIELVSFKEGEDPRDFEANELEATVEYQEPGGELVTVPASSLRIDLGREVNVDSKWGVHDRLVLSEWDTNVFDGAQPAGTTVTLHLLKKGAAPPNNEVAQATWQLQ